MKTMVLLTVEHHKEIPDLLDKIAGRVHKKKELDIELLRETFSYEPETGRLVWVKLTPRVRRSSLGNEAGTLDRASGYRFIDFKGARYLAHRLIWAYVHGAMPDGFIDHINRIRDDNRISNLRVVDASGNAQNRACYNLGKTGFAGVIKHHNRYRATISPGKQKKINLGSFRTPEEAHARYLEAKALLHPMADLDKYARPQSHPHSVTARLIDLCELPVVDMEPQE